MNHGLLAIGGVTFGLVQIIWTLGHVYAGWRGAWVMKSGSGIAFCFAVFVIVALGGSRAA